MGQIIVGNKTNILNYTFTAAAKTLAISNNMIYDMQFDTLISVYNVTRSAFFNFQGMTPLSLVKSTDSSGLPVYTWTFVVVPPSSADGDTLVVTVGCPDVFMNYTALLSISGATI